MEKKRKIITLCNAGKERSRMLASSLEKVLSETGWVVEVLARGTYGLGGDNNGVQTKYGWVPPEGFVELLKEKGINLPTYPSRQLSEAEAREADYLVAVDPIIAERAKRAFPEYSEKVIIALEAIPKGENPFHDYLGYSIPDAWGGHLSKVVRDILHKKGKHEEKMTELESRLGEELSADSKAFVASYDPKSIDPTNIKVIPAQLRDYMGCALDSDEAYLNEADNLTKVAGALHREMVK